MGQAELGQFRYCLKLCQDHLGQFIYLLLLVLGTGKVTMIAGGGQE